ncbi:MoaD/ThiS family protein [Desulfosarcina sp.]|uniref:MoaD/ThiS family protein n=1 Tax=Desulfosarcina sp. TaxID=2027861 RepID=UPI003564A48D
MTIQLTVKVYGTLDRWIPGYNPETGCVVHVAVPSTVADLIDHLGIPPRSVGIVSINGRAAQKADLLPDRALIKVFHPIFGG